MTPRISVVPTRNRHNHAAPCACSILADAGDDFELSVIDQSDAAAERLWQFTPAIIAAQGRRPTGLGLIGCMLAAPIHRSNGGSICTQRLVAPQNSGVNR